jgi:hypothetical protein
MKTTTIGTGILGLVMAGTIWGAIYFKDRTAAAEKLRVAEREFIETIAEANAWQEIGFKYAKADADIEIKYARQSILAAELAMRTARDARDLAIATEELHDAKAKLASAEDEYRKAEHHDRAIAERLRKAGETRMEARRAAGEQTELTK